MRIAVLVAESQANQTDIASSIDHFHYHTFEIIPINKRTVVSQILNLEASGRFDVFLNLCDGGSWENDSIADQVVQTLHKINAAYTGAEPIFFNLIKQTTKMAAHISGLSISNHQFFDSIDDYRSGSTVIKFPALVKRPYGHECEDRREEIEVSCAAEMEKEVENTLRKFRGALVEEVIRGAEYAVLVAEKPNQPDDPMCLLPVEKKSTNDRIEQGKIGNFGQEWKSVNEPSLIDRLTKAAKIVFLACNGTGYALAKFKIDESSRIYFVDLIANCRLFGRSSNICCPTDYIFAVDREGSQKFLACALDLGLERQKRCRKKLKVRLDPIIGYHTIAAENFDAGEVVLKLENRPAYLVGRKCVETWKASNPLKNRWMLRNGYQISKNVFDTWNEDGNKWTPINHSCDPNCWLNEGSVDFVAKRPIKKGEEVTIDYGTCMFSDDPDLASCQLKCWCSSKECRKIVRPSEDFKSPEFIKKYAGHLSDIVQDRSDCFRAAREK